MNKKNLFSLIIYGLGEDKQWNNLTANQKLTLRFIIVGIIYYAFAFFEGLLMRIYLANPNLLSFFIDDKHYYAILTAHPLVGIFGGTYSFVLGAFYFVLPFLMKKPLWNIKLAFTSFWLNTIGVFIFWLSGFLSHYSPLYTLYWPLPADFTQFEPIGGIFFILGIALCMVGAIFFVIIVFKTITYTPNGWSKQPSSELLSSALGITALVNIFRKKEKQLVEPVPIGVAAIARGSVDMFLNALVITFTGVLILIYMIAYLFGTNLKHSWIDALLYKNWFWWGLDLIADGLVLIFVAGTWYILVQLITGAKNIFMEKWARALLFVELVVSWFVWSHHLLSDQAQPMFLKLISGQFITAIELVTQGLALFITLVTLWHHRPLKLTPELKFLLGGLTGFALGVAAGIIQADIGMNRILHNTQWIVGPHVHVAILVGLMMTLYAVVYKLFPILTNNISLYSKFLINVHFWLQLFGGVGMGAFMGMAGLLGMLRRTIYHNNEFGVFMWLAAIAGIALFVGFLSFFLNIVLSVGIKGIINVFKKADYTDIKLLPENNI
ncbi:MAG: cbb3-type cytochrome c oxidase subunit I [Bacteroidales bacterium]|nr:cbb3-type cytochrome c oxidase subunit I [Bacteroidales bacterium]